jgi:hypothetical protein
MPKATLMPNVHPQAVWKSAGEGGKKQKQVVQRTGLPHVVALPSFVA